VKRFDSINVIPFIDIMLVLLAIVLTTASFVSQSQIKINLPVAESSQAVSDQQPVELALSHPTGIYFNSEQLNFQELETRLAQLDKSTPIVLRVDRETSFHRFVAVVDQLKLQKLASLSILTRNNP
jgi:biopolymer transport protein ExbD